MNEHLTGSSGRSGSGSRPAARGDETSAQKALPRRAGAGAGQPGEACGREELRDEAAEQTHTHTASGNTHSQGTSTRASFPKTNVEEVRLNQITDILDRLPFGREVE